MKIVLMHGKNTDSDQKWYPWFREEVERMGHTCMIPALPNAADPVMDEWLLELDKTKPDIDTVLVGHSRGGVAILRWLEKEPKETRIKRVILVATNSGSTTDRAIPSESNHGFYTESGFNFEKIKSHCEDIVVLHSKDDAWVPFSDGEKNAKGLSAPLLAFESYGHFGKGVTEIPELIRELNR
jgi:predicted alpha/beta hydrolase family esterase